MNLTPDFSLVVQIVTFVFLWAFLKRFLFDPTIQVLATREERTTGTIAGAEHLKVEAATAQENYEEAVHEARVKIGQESDAARKAAQDAHNQAVATARAAAGDELNRVRESLSGQLEEARRTLASQAQTIAFDMVDRVMGRSAS